MFFLLSSPIFRMASKAIQWLAMLALSTWLSIRWGTALGQGQSRDGSSAAPSGLIMVATSLTIVFGLYLVLRQVRRAIFRSACQLLVRKGPGILLPIGVWNLLSASVPARTTDAPDYAGLIALHKTYDSLDASRRSRIVEVVYALEDWPSPVAKEAQMFLDAVSESRG
jgi:hypothetical protein